MLRDKGATISKKRLAEAHLKISATLLVQTKNSTDLERVAATQLKSVEFFVCTTRVTEIFDVHTDFTAGEMLHLYRSMTHVPALYAPVCPAYALAESDVARMHSP